MGAKLVSSAIVHALPKLGRHHTARVVLLTMCAVAKDTDPEPRYYAGPEHLAMVLGLDSQGRELDRTLSRATSALAAGGWIERDPTRPRHWRAEWLIHLPLSGKRGDVS